MANQALRQEINLICGSVTGTGTVTANGLIQLDLTQYSGTPTFYFEAVFNGAASNTGTIKLHGNSSGTDDASLSGATSSTYIVSRVAFTPTSQIYVLKIVGDGVRTQTVHSARIIILQNEPSITKTETQIEIGNQTGALTNTSVADITNPKFWKYTAANWDGTKTFNVDVVWTTSAKNTVTITLCRTSDNAVNTTIVSAGSNSTGYTRNSASFTPVDGETYKIRALGSTTKSSYSIASAKIIVDQSNQAKLEPQYLLLNTGDAGTGAQNMLTTYNASEWDAGSGTITTTHLMDSDNASNTAKIVTGAGADTGSSSAAPAGTIQQESTAFTLLNATNYDTNVTNSTGVVAASRLKFVYSFVAAAVTTLIELVTEPMTPSKWNNY